MPVGRLATPLEEARDAPLTFDVRFFLDAAKTQPLAITDANGWLQIQDGSQPSFPMSVSNGRMVLNGGVVGVRVAQADIALLKPGPYNFEVQALDATGMSRQVRGVLKLDDTLADLAS